MPGYSKQQARAIVQARLDSISPGEFQALAAVVRSNVRDSLSSLVREDKLHKVLSYHASVKWREIDLTPLEQEFDGVAFDYVQLDPNAPMPGASYDAILVPLYGFNANGYRLGHGGGWYDKYLASQPRAYKVGVGLDAGGIDFISELHDIPMDIVITQSGLLRTH